MFVKIFDNYHAGARLLPEAEQDAFYGGVMRYAFDGIEPEFEGTAAAVWATIKDFIDKSIEGQGNGSKGGNGRGNKNPGKDAEETQPETTVEKTREKGGSKTPSENQKKRIEGNRKENLEGFFSNSREASGDAAAVKDTAPPDAKPVCPMCRSPLERTGMPDPEFWWCDACRDSFPEGKAEREAVA